MHGPSDTLADLHITLERAGFVVVGILNADVYDGTLDLEALVDRYGVRVIVWDLAPPFETSWNVFQACRRLPRLQRCRFVIATGARSLTKITQSAESMAAVFGGYHHGHRALRPVS